jgi:hypothetical protein
MSSYAEIFCKIINNFSIVQEKGHMLGIFCYMPMKNLLHAYEKNIS